MMKIDERFLKIHPRTVEWQRQRKKCAKCAHLIRPPGATRESMRCSAVPNVHGIGNNRNGKHDAAYCIDAREGACGPAAALFKAK
jgi:hypothetical protein